MKNIFAALVLFFAMQTAVSAHASVQDMRDGLLESLVLGARSQDNMVQALSAGKVRKDEVEFIRKMVQAKLETEILTCQGLGFSDRQCARALNNAIYEFQRSHAQYGVSERSYRTMAKDAQQALLNRIPEGGVEW